MGYVWNDKLDNTFEGYKQVVEYVDQYIYKKLRLYVDKPCSLLINDSIALNVADSIEINVCPVNLNEIKSCVIIDKGINYYWEGEYA